MFPTRCSKNDDSVCILVRDIRLEERNVNRALIIAFHRGVKKNTSKRYWRKKKKNRERTFDPRCRLLRVTTWHFPRFAMALIKRHPTTSLSTSELPGQRKSERGWGDEIKCFMKLRLNFLFFFSTS